MRAVVKCFACLTTITPLALATPQGDSAPSYYLRGFYKLLDQEPTWQLSDASPWQVAKNETWVNPRLVKWGYVPVVHAAERYYCLIDHSARTGSHIVEWIFVCGDPGTTVWLFNNNRRPVLRLYGGP